MIWAIVADWLHADCQDEAARLRAHIQRLTGLCHDREVQLGEHHVLVERCKDLEAQVRALETRAKPKPKPKKGRSHAHA